METFEQPKITGYRQLSEQDAITMNGIKKIGEALGEVVARLQDRPDLYDARWVSIGATDLQKGLMGLVRAVAKPTTF